MGILPSSICGSVLENLFLVGTGDGSDVFSGESGTNSISCRNLEIPSTKESGLFTGCGTTGLGVGIGSNGVMTETLVGLDEGVK